MKTCKISARPWELDMGANVIGLRWWMAVLLPLASLNASGSDLRLVEAVKNQDAASAHLLK